MDGVRRGVFLPRKMLQAGIHQPERSPLDLSSEADQISGFQQGRLDVAPLPDAGLNHRFRIFGHEPRVGLPQRLVPQALKIFFYEFLVELLDRFAHGYSRTTILRASARALSRASKNIGKSNF